ncbi:putative two-component system response regulator [Rhodoferax ferrireducens]|uniref:Two-component system response regulator n=1 Tax=Rhodoferax ferrireducens TaxID=192843 RepID=A0ABU2CAY0_9BURK|nr:HD domain-containing phosphohydrolase [Rhodoferax ferrireducens]MDR7378473.1 putative two-component system response regulator [Rhodoferax ferrireducens]
MFLPTILIVDDEPGNLAIMRSILQDTYSLAFARNGDETLAAVVKHQPAMVLLDIGLPDTNGYDLCRRIKQLDTTHTTQVIFVTGYTDLVHEAAGFEAGAVDYIAKPVSPPIVRARVAAHLSLVRAAALEQSHRDAVLMLGQAGHYNDSDTGSHIWRMAAYARVIAQACGWDAESCARLELAAPMHDTGKLGVPHTILRKPGPLTAEEWDTMKTHSQIGHEILSKSKAPVFQLAAEIALRHHERWDGSGYPDGLQGQDIPKSARIVALADVLDALSMRRPYKEAWPMERVVEYIHAASGTHFDPMVVHAFASVLPELIEIGRRWAEMDQLEQETTPQAPVQSR